MPRSTDNSRTPARTEKALREERRARALRANLHRRKAQARGRGGRGPAGNVGDG